MRPLEPLGTTPIRDAPLDGDPDALAFGADAEAPVWQRDALAVSSRVRALIAALSPLVVRVRGFWDHLVRRVALSGGRALEVDPAGSYRLRLG